MANFFGPDNPIKIKDYAALTKKLNWKDKNIDFEERQIISQKNLAGLV